MQEIFKIYYKGCFSTSFCVSLLKLIVFMMRNCVGIKEIKLHQHLMFKIQKIVSIIMFKNESRFGYRNQFYFRAKCFSASGEPLTA